MLTVERARSHTGSGFPPKAVALAGLVALFLAGGCGYRSNLRARKAPAVRPNPKAIEVLREARQAADALGKEGHTLLWQISEAQVRAGDVSGALESANLQSGDYGIGKAITLRYIASAQAETGDVQGALKTAGSIEKKWSPEKGEALKAIAKAQATAWDVRAALRTADEVERTLAKGVSTTTSTQLGLKYYPILEKALTLAEIAGAQAKNGDPGGAQKTVKAVHRLSEGAGPQRALIDSATTPALTEIAAAQAKARDVKGALKTAETIGKPGRDLTLSRIANAQVETGDIDGARRTAEKISDIHIVASLSLAVMRQQLKSGNVQAALQTANGSADGAVKANALTQIASAQAKAGDRTAAAGTLQQALSATESLTDSFAKVSALTQVASAQSRVGDRAGATASLKAARQAAETIVKPQGFGQWRSKDYALQLISASQAATGDFEGALKTAGAIKEDTSRKYACWNVAKEQMKAGHKADATKTKQSVLATPGKLDWLILSSMIESGDVESALAWARKQKSPSSKAQALISVGNQMLIAAKLNAAKAKSAEPGKKQ